MILTNTPRQGALRTGGPAKRALQSRPWARAQSVRDTGQEPSSKLQQRRVAILGVDLGIHAHHHGFQGPQYGPQLYSEASSLICAASNWSCAIDCCNPSCL